MKHFSLYVNGQWLPGVEQRTILSPYDGKPFAAVEWAGEAQVEAALQAAQAATDVGLQSKTHERAQWLEGIRDGMTMRLDEMAETISEEAQAFLIRTKGDIIQNYLLDEAGNYVLPDIHRKAAPNMQVEPVQINSVDAFWFSNQKASGTNLVVVYFHGGGYRQRGIFTV